MSLSKITLLEYNINDRAAQSIQNDTVLDTKQVAVNGMCKSVNWTAYEGGGQLWAEAKEKSDRWRDNIKLADDVIYDGGVTPFFCV